MDITYRLYLENSAGLKEHVANFDIDSRDKMKKIIFNTKPEKNKDTRFVIDIIDTSDSITTGKKLITV